MTWGKQGNRTLRICLFYPPCFPNCRTNKGAVIRLGRDQHTFRLIYVSNSEILPGEFESWKKYSSQAGIKPPTVSFINQKSAEIYKYLTNPICDESIVEQVSNRPFYPFNPFL